MFSIYRFLKAKPFDQNENRNFCKITFELCLLEEEEKLISNLFKKLYKF